MNTMSKLAVLAVVAGLMACRDNSIALPQVVALGEAGHSGYILASG
jgi:hypothetical protein